MITYNNSVLKVGSSWLGYTPPVYYYSLFIDIDTPSLVNEPNIAICSLKIDGQSATTAQMKQAGYMQNPETPHIYSIFTDAEKNQILSTSTYLYKSCYGIWVKLANNYMEFSTLSFKTTPSTASITNVNLVASLYKGTTNSARLTLIDQYAYTQRGNTTITLNRLA